MKMFDISNNPMTLKTYTSVKAGIAVFVAAVFAGSIVLERVVLPIGLLALALAVLGYLRRRVPEVIEDERDRQLGGKAALVSMQVFAWIAVVAVFVLYAARTLNPAYETIGTTFAFSACLLMLVYSAVYRYYQKIVFDTRRGLYVAAAALVFGIVIVAAVRLFAGEDDWICSQGKWVKHGNPSFPAPTTQCR
jgi:uncharacterized membrane protein